jgi:hypothetical protein
MIVQDQRVHGCQVRYGQTIDIAGLLWPIHMARRIQWLENAQQLLCHVAAV